MRTEYEANNAMSLPRTPATRARDSAAFGYDRIGQHAFKPGKPRVIFTRPTMLQRITRAIRDWL